MAPQHRSASVALQLGNILVVLAGRPVFKLGDFGSACRGEGQVLSVWLVIRMLNSRRPVRARFWA